MCQACWVNRRGLRVPVRVKDSPVANCCFCGRDTTGGIYVRARPASDEVPWCADNPLDRSLFFSRL
jgi:hypothetical protein